MMFIVYKTINTHTNEYYIGVHKTTTFVFDGYFGSGRRIVRSVKKYGKEYFVRITLFEYDDDSEKLAFLKETEILAETLADPRCLNLSHGGKGGSNFKGKKHTLESRQKMGRPGSCPSAETRRKISEANSRRTVSEETKTKISIKKYLAQGKTLEEATHLAQNRLTKNSDKRSKSQALTEFYKNPDNRQQKAEQMRKLDKEYDLLAIKLDYEAGLKPKEIMRKYSLTKNRFDHIRAYYLKNNLS